MRLMDSKARVLELMARDLRASGAAVQIDPASPDPRDEGKFMLAGLPARVVQRFSGWHAYLSPDWFEGLWSMPRIQTTEFYWYVFHIPAYGRFASVAECEHHVALYGRGGESEAHRLLKLYIAERPQLLGLSVDARASVEHSFLTGDRVDVMFGNHDPQRSVVEVEVEGEQNLVIGVHQAIKYRALAASADGFALVDPTVRAYVVAYETRYALVDALARDYGVRLVSVPREDVLRRVA